MNVVAYDKPVHRTVLELVDHKKYADHGGPLAGKPYAVVFSTEPGDPGQPVPVFQMPLEKWNDLGKPKAITVTVRAGDLLNDPHPFVPDRQHESAWCQSCGNHVSVH